MATTAYQIQQRQKGLEKYIEIYGIELLNKIAQDKKGVDILKMTTTDLSNLKTTLNKKGFKDFIITNQRLPNESEATSLGHKFSKVRAAEKLKNPPKIPADTSPVYNKAEGYIYPRGTPGGTVYSKKIGSNQFPPIRSLEEVQKAIDNAPLLPINGKLYKQNPKDLTGTSEYSSKEVITVRESEKYGKKLKYPTTGAKQIEDPTKGSIVRKNKIIPTQGGEISIIGGRNIFNKNLGHVYPIIKSYKPNSKLTNIIDAKKNNKLIGFNRIGQKIAEDQEWYIKNKPQNYVEEIEKLNGKAKLNVKNAIEKLGPGYKGDIGYFLVNPETGEFTPKAGNYKNSIASLEGEKIVYKDLTSGERSLFSQKISQEVFDKAPKETQDLFRSIAELKPGSSSFKKVCTNLKASGGTIDSCLEIVAKDPEAAANKFKNLDVQSGPLAKVKSAANTFLNVAKKGGRFGAFAAVGAAASAVKQFMSDDPTSYLSDENQQKNMLIDMVTEPVIEERDPGITSSAQLPVLGAVTAAGAIPGGAEYYKDRRGIRPNDKFTGPMNKGVGKIRAAASPISGLLGKGLAATGTPLGMLALEPLYIGSQLAAGDSIGDIATNPINYLGAAFASPLTQQATKFASPAVSSFMRLGISPTMLKTVSRRFGLPGLALSAGISGYEMFNNKRQGRGLFDDG